MPRHRNNASERQPATEVRLMQIKKDVIELPLDETSTEDREDQPTSTSNQVILNQDNTEQQQQEQPKQPKMKLPNFLSRHIDNFTSYLGTVPKRIVGPRSLSFDSQLEQPRTPHGSRYARVQSLDREEGATLTFLSQRMGGAENIGALYQRSDPYQLGYNHNNDDPDNDMRDADDELDMEEHPCLGKDAECQIV